MKTSAKQLAYVRDWEKRHPEQAQARKNAWWKTPKGKAAVKRRRKKFNAYRRKWRAERAKAKAANVADEPRAAKKLNFWLTFHDSTPRHNRRYGL